MQWPPARDKTVQKARGTQSLQCFERTIPFLRAMQRGDLFEQVEHDIERGRNHRRGLVTTDSPLTNEIFRLPNAPKDIPRAIRLRTSIATHHSTSFTLNELGSDTHDSCAAQGYTVF